VIANNYHRAHLLRGLRFGAPAASAGFGLIAAIAILVILATLGAFIVSVTGLRDQGTALDVLGSRALQAARAGVEWNMYIIQNREDTNPAAGPFTTPYPCTIPGTLNGLTGALSDFTVIVTCTITLPGGANTEAGNTVRVYKIESVACNQPAAGPVCSGGGPAYVERKLTVLTETCRGAPAGASC
jgi:MSHA biogenesis protein MshP